MNSILAWLCNYFLFIAGLFYNKKLFFSFFNRFYYYRHLSLFLIVINRTLVLDVRAISVSSS